MDAAIFGYVHIQIESHCPGCFLVVLGPVDRVLGAPALGAVAGVWLSAGDRARHRMVTDNGCRGGQRSVDLRPPLRAPGRVFVNPGTRLRIEPGTVVGGGWRGAQRNLVDIPFAFGSINTVSYTTMPGALIVSRGRFWTPKARPLVRFNFPSWATLWTVPWGLMCVGCGAVWRCAVPPRPTP